MIWNKAAVGEGGVRFYLSYSGSRPSAPNCVTLAGDIQAAAATNLGPLISTAIAMDEIDVLDIQDSSGASGQNTTTWNGTRSGSATPVQVCTGVEYNIARRYRGGKPRGYWPFGTTSDYASGSSWSPGFVSASNAGMLAFFTAVNGLSVGSMGTLQHVNLSFYKGYVNIENPDSRAFSRPTYRSPNAIHDNVSGYSTKTILSSQRRRRTSTTP